ncbi:bile acid:sodium symporter [Micromonospora sp. WMMD1128]|uniref:bile acid:sodium symporter family protein n=1 Tax=Micromonospora sp. WMMD1128 TaxID=3015150 RepID=UPI00248CBB35|nr:bile acid:sodium symporter family protein [Micromonospora sp. WMMD1128]WBB72670.1 bile acid:sodium symporter [Micromonospora sp. WMMD1128]
MNRPRRLPVDPYVAAMVATVAVATVLPARGVVATVAGWATTAAVALLFFLYGARISRREAWTGAAHWRLHLAVLLTTFALFPAYGLLLGLLSPSVLDPQLHQGLLFLCAVPSTVQSAIALTSIAGGNVPAAIFSASFSSVAGIALTPLLVGAMMGGAGDVHLSPAAFADIALRLLLPFVAGQLVQPWLGGWMKRHRKPLTVVDRGSILLVVYTAFSASVVSGVWSRVSVSDLLVLLVVEAALLAAVLLTLATLPFDRPDRIAIAFCGSTKSAAAGLPMATVLFSGPAAGLLILPLIIFHQLQLITGTVLARRWAERGRTTPGDDAAPRAEPSPS